MGARVVGWQVKRIKVLLADDHDPFRRTLRRLLESNPDVEVVGEAENGRMAVEQADRLAPDVVVMDIAMPEINGLAATRLIRKRLAHVRVVVLTVHDSEEYVSAAFDSGASAYVLKEEMREALLPALVRVCQESESDPDQHEGHVSH
ncbi:MAG: response regulator transcription factor [Chloroflexota bacterium]|nr:MAG: response regulator transcription factor [Chloroflexota bacterium]